MVDNTTLNAGAGGDIIATDDIAGVKHQLVKVEFGAPDSATPVSAANPFPVDGSGVTQPVSAASLPLPAGAATAANQLPNSHDVTVDNAGGATSVPVQGAAAHDAAVSGNPVLLGGEARTTNPTSVADGDAVRMQMDKAGRPIVVLSGVRERVVDNLINLQGASETTLLIAQGASIFADLTALIITNGTATPVAVSIRSATAGSVRMVVNIAARGGAVIPFNHPFKQTAANNNWTAQLSAVLAAPGLDITVQAVTNL